MEKYNTLKSKQDFIDFISKKNEYFNNIMDILNKENLDFSEKEIREVSKYFISLNKNNKFDNNHKREFITYIGEAFKSKYGGDWFFTGLKKDSYAINEPVITNYKNEAIRKSPSEVIFMIFEKNDENYFISSNKFMEDWNKKTEDIFNELFPKKNKKK